MYYSKVLGFAADNLIDAEDHGGNRGGGTDITAPPTFPTPDPPGNSHDSGNTTPEPEPESEPEPISEPTLEPLSEPVPDTASEPSRAVSVAVGCTAVVGTIGVTALCLHPQAFKRFLELLQKLLLKS